MKTQRNYIIDTDLLKLLLATQDGKGNSHPDLLGLIDNSEISDIDSLIAWAVSDSATGNTSFELVDVRSNFNYLLNQLTLARNVVDTMIDKNGKMLRVVDNYALKQYTYIIDLEERGEFSAHVEDLSGNVVFEISGFEMFEDGFMKHKDDKDGLLQHLVSLSIVSADSKLN